jgi:hypothetical protein
MRPQQKIAADADFPQVDGLISNERHRAANAEGTVAIGIRARSGSSTDFNWKRADARSAKLGRFGSASRRPNLVTPSANPEAPYGTNKAPRQ